MKKDKVIIGVVGVGYWGINLVRNFYSTDRGIVGYACDLSRETLSRMKKAYPTIRVVEKYSEILEDKEVDLICIATPPAAHFRIAKKCIEARKNILIEKPMSKTVKEAETLIALARKNNVQIFVDHTFVFSSAVRKIKECIEEHKIGEPLYFDSERINLGLLQKDINVIWDLAPHDFSIFNYLFPSLRPISVQVSASRHKHPYLEDLAHVTVKYQNDFIMHVHLSWLSPLKIRKIIIGGDKGMICYDDIHPYEKIKIYDKGVRVNRDKETPFFPIYREGDIIIPKVRNYEALALEANHIVSCVLGKDKPLVDGYDGLKVVRLLEACDKAILQKREIFLK